MPLRFYNTASRRVELFEPIERGHVRLYTCGPTVWNFAHVGNFRTFLFYDLLRRHLLYRGHRLTHVENLTDVEDRIIRLARERGVTIRRYVEPYEKAFLEDLETLRIQRPEAMPRATEHIAGMVAMTATLVEKGFAYLADGDVYYRVDSFADYGKLAHLDRHGLKTGAHGGRRRTGFARPADTRDVHPQRVSADDYDKHDVVDFALWKGEQPGEAEVGAAWDAPFGRGRPGWHIECSAMSKAYLGDTFDIHAGGIDLLFPHHQNEVAQSEAANGKPLAHFWLHAEHLADATGAKMSKRLGNIATLRDLLDAGHDALAIRFFLIAGAHYRQRLRLDEAGLHSAGEQVRRLRELWRRTGEYRPRAQDDAALVQDLVDLRGHYEAALDEDLNLPQAVGYLFDAVREANVAMDAGQAGSKAIAELRRLLEVADEHLDILRGEELILDAETERLIAERETARRGRDFTRADSIRQQLRDRGIQLEDTAQGVRATRIRT